MFDSLWDDSVVQTIGDRILEGKLPALLSIVTYSEKLAKRLKREGPWTIRTSAQVQTSDGEEEPQAFCDATKQVRPIALWAPRLSSALHASSPARPATCGHIRLISD